MKKKTRLDAGNEADRGGARGERPGRKSGTQPNELRLRRLLRCYVSSRHGKLPAHGEQITIDAVGLRNEYLDPVAVVGEDEDELVAAGVLLNDFGCWGELGVAKVSLPEEIRQDRNAAFTLNRLDGVVGLDHEHVAVLFRVIRLAGADLYEPRLDQSADGGIGDARRLLGTTKDEHDGARCCVACV